jgi:uncharacterized protein YcfJ
MAVLDMPIAFRWSLKEISMNAVLRTALAVTGLAMATHAAAQITFYENENFAGRSFTTQRQVNNFERFGFNDRASSAVVRSDRWEVCEDIRFGGRCVVLRRGQYASLAAMGLNDRVSSVRMVNRNARIGDERYPPPPPPQPAPPPVVVQSGQITFYEHDNFQGRTFTTTNPVDDFRRFGFNDLASSAVVRGERWEVCDNVQYGGRCVILRQGSYPSLGTMGLNDRISSVRTVATQVTVDERRYAPPPEPVYNYRRRSNETLYEANITSVRAVVAAANQRCWVERGQVVQDRGNANAGGAVVGAIIGGILGHQVGSGSGRDAATAVGVVAGAAVGANANRDRGGQQVVTQDVQRCSSVPSQARPEYWDVTYNFRGQEYRVQMTNPPGATVTVNEQGEPRE